MRKYFWIFLVGITPCQLRNAPPAWHTDTIQISVAAPLLSLLVHSTLISANRRREIEGERERGNIPFLFTSSWTQYSPDLLDDIDIKYPG